MSIYGQEANNFSPIIQFYHPEIRSTIGPHSLNSVLEFDHDKLEDDHTYIQIIFPLPEPSPINHFAPPLDSKTVTYFRDDPILRRELRRMFGRMLNFYGLEISLAPLPPQPSTGGATPLPTAHVERKLYTIVKCPVLYPRWPLWVRNFSHNHLRITRIIRSLRILGCQAEAEAFFRAVKTIAEDSGKISATSVKFWTRAARRRLNVPPEAISDDDNGGQAWLRGLNDLVGDELEERFILFRHGAWEELEEGEEMFGNHIV